MSRDPLDGVVVGEAHRRSDAFVAGVHVRGADHVGDAGDRELIRAAADSAQGAVFLAEGDGAGAVECLRRAADLWRDANAPYDRARTRALLARALLEHGERSRAQGELQAARAAFEALGARLDLAHLAEFDAASAEST